MIENRSRVIDLPTPLKENGREIPQLVLGPPKIGDKRQAEHFLANGTQGAAGTKFQINMIGRNTGLLDATIEQLEIDAFNEAWEFIAGFLVYSPETT